MIGDGKEFLFLRDGEHKDWFHDRYVDNLGLQAYDRGRWPTFKIALNLWFQQNGKNIVETGCQRERDDWGSGASTFIFTQVMEHYGKGHLHSVDISEEHLNRAREIVGSHSRVTFHCFDSVDFLHQFNEPIDLLYLDSADYPIAEICESYGGEPYEQSVLQLQQMSETMVLDRHGHLLKETQEHCLNELKAAETHLHNQSIVLIDDSSLPGGGKARLARNYLYETGWTVVLDYKQTLWIKR